MENLVFTLLVLGMTTIDKLKLEKQNYKLTKCVFPVLVMFAAETSLWSCLGTEGDYLYHRDWLDGHAAEVEGFFFNQPSADIKLRLSQYKWTYCRFLLGICKHGLYMVSVKSEYLLFMVSEFPVFTFLK